jgi:hypothetical protein
MTFRIERIFQEGRTRICLSGDIRSAQLEDVRAEIAKVVPPVSLDLEEVGLVDIDVVRWLNLCQAQGIEVDNCAPYIREWMHQEKLGSKK